VRDICSLKPSLGSWPGQDVIPVNYDQDTCGPMARTVGDVELLHRIASGRNKTTADVSRSLRVGYLGKSISIEFVFFLCFYVLSSGESIEGNLLIQSLTPFLPLTTLVDLNADEVLGELISSVLDSSNQCNTSFRDILCYALARDIPAYLSSHSSFYSHQTLASLIEWNSSHREYIPYGQSLFLRAQNSSITAEVYNKYKQTINESFQKLVEYLRKTYNLDCLLTIGNDDILTCTTICGIPRANLTLDYYDPKHQQLNVVAVGFASGDDFLLLRLLQRFEKANLQAGMIDIRTRFQKYVQYPFKSIYEKLLNLVKHK